MVNTSNPQPVNELSHRTIKEICTFDPQSFDTNKKKMGIESCKRQDSEEWHIYFDSNTDHLRYEKVKPHQ